MLNYIIWNVNPEIFSLGSFSIRWYGLLFASGFLIGQYIMSRIFKIENKPEKDLERLMIYMVIATVVGARLGHCFFYEPEKYLSNPIEILKVWEGGLASHGAAIGILLGLYLYSRNRAGQSFLWVVDRIVIVVALGGALIRMGNLMNSEIIGKPADVPFAFIFANSLDESLYHRVNKKYDYLEDVSREFTEKPDTVVDNITYTPLNITLHFNKAKVEESYAAVFAEDSLSSFLYGYETSKHYTTLGNIKLPTTTKQTAQYTEATALAYGIPRHPAQLYESLSMFLLFCLLMFLYLRLKEKTPEGLFLGIFLTVVFTLRFLYEFLKENQVDWEDGRYFNQGQLLSIPAVVAGLVILFIAYRNYQKQKTLADSKS